MRRRPGQHGFNRTARELAKVEEDRTVMLAGISHDLRTPLARIRLEAEMSVDDEEAKHNKAVQRMGGTFELANAVDGGLMAHIRLKKAP